MSDLTRLFRLCGTGPKPLENFTTAALAIAIGHDAAPITSALRSVALDGAIHEDQRTIRLMRDALSSEGVRVTAETQQPLFEQVGQDGLSLGYLDLVLTIPNGSGSSLAAWIEVKVDAWDLGGRLKFSH